MKKIFSFVLTFVLIISTMCSPVITNAESDFDLDMSEVGDNSIEVTYDNLDGSESLSAADSFTTALYTPLSESDGFITSVEYNSDTYIFDGWYFNGNLVSTDVNYTFYDRDDATQLSANLITRNVLVGGAGFESYVGGGNLRVEPANQGVAPYDDKWGIYAPWAKDENSEAGYEQPDHSYSVKGASGKFTDGYLSDLVMNDETGEYTKVWDEYSIKPYDGDTMMVISAPSRSVTRKLAGLKPNTTYTLNFNVCYPDEWDFIKTITVADTYDLPPNKTTSSTAEFYATYVEPYSLEDATNLFEMKDKSKVRQWSEISISFTTGEANNPQGTVDAYMHLSLSSKAASSTKSRILLDNLTCTEDIISNAGNSIRVQSAELPQALRYKFSVQNSKLEAYESLTAKEVGILVAPTDALAGEELVIGGKYTYEGKNLSPKNKTVNPNSNYQYVDGDDTNTYFTAALYNIGYDASEKTIDYTEYDTAYSVRPYAVYTTAQGRELVFYADTVDTSVFEVMNAILQEQRDSVDIAAVYSLLDNEELYDAYIAWQPTNGWYVGESTATGYDYSMAVVGDIQKTTGFYPDKLHYTYDWIINNAENSKIEYVIGLGDVSETSDAAEYATAETEFKRLQTAGIDQTIIRGNHDWDFDNYITLDEYKTDTMVSYDGTMKNTYKLVTIGGVKYMMLVLDLFPTDDELAWAETVVSEHPDYNVILTTHAYFDHDMSLTQDDDISWVEDKSTANSGQDMYDKLISKYSNIVLVLCGHRYPPDDGPNYRVSTRDDGSKVMQMMVNPQYMEQVNGRAYGMVAMLYFSNGGKNVSLEYFSTISGLYYMDKFQFSFELDLVE